MNKVLEHKYLIILVFICLTALFICQGHYSNILIDFGREVYYPERILEGKVLYRDLFNIYGPFAYLFNAFLYKIFGIKLGTLYFSGVVCSLLIVGGVYLISKQFLSNFLSFSIGLFTIATGVTTMSIFNFTFPYSWAMLYGFVAFLYSVFFLLKIDDEDYFLCISSLLAGIAACCKYEFLAYFVFVAIIIIAKRRFQSFIPLLFPAIICFGFLFYQGLTLNDFANSLAIIYKMSQTETLKFFYQNVGAMFHVKSIPFLLGKFAIVAVAFLYLLKAKIKVFPVILCLMLSFYTTWTTFAFLPLLVIVATAVFYKKLSQKELVVIICAILLSLKSIWCLIILGYGLYYTGFLIIALMIILTKFGKFGDFQKTAGVFLCTICFYFFYIGLLTPLNLNSVISFDRGSIYTDEWLGNESRELIHFLKKTDKNDKVVIFPEGMMINFLAERKGDDFYNSLIPLYVETFGEEAIIEHFKKTKPEYIVFNNTSMRDYGFKNICVDYAQGFCYYVTENYSRVWGKLDEHRQSFLVYKKK